MLLDKHSAYTRIHHIVSICRVLQDFLVEMGRQDLRYTWDMIKPSLMLLYLDIFFLVKCTDIFSGFAWRDRTSRSHWKNWTKGELKHHRNLHHSLTKIKSSQYVQSQFS